MGARHEPRKLVNLTATVCGVDVRGQSFIERVEIRNMSGRGMLVETVGCPVEPGETVVVRYRENRARFQAVWATQLQDRPLKQLGLRHLLSTALIWDPGIPLPAPDEYQQPRLQVRRGYRRFNCELPAELLFEGSKSPLWTSTGNVGERGCFVHMLNVPPIGTRIDVALWLGDVKMWAQGTVVSSVSGFGVGIKFMVMSHDSRLRLRQALSESGIEVQDRRLEVDQELAGLYKEVEMENGEP